MCFLLRGLWGLLSFKRFAFRINVKSWYDVVSYQDFDFFAARKIQESCLLGFSQTRNIGPMWPDVG